MRKNLHYDGSVFDTKHFRFVFEQCISTTKLYSANVAHEGGNLQQMFHMIVFGYVSTANDLQSKYVSQFTKFTHAQKKTLNESK